MGSLPKLRGMKYKWNLVGARREINNNDWGQGEKALTCQLFMWVFYDMCEREEPFKFKEYPESDKIYAINIMEVINNMFKSL